MAYDKEIDDIASYVSDVTIDSPLAVSRLPFLSVVLPLMLTD